MGEWAIIVKSVLKDVNRKKKEKRFLTYLFAPNDTQTQNEAHRTNNHSWDLKIERTYTYAYINVCVRVCVCLCARVCVDNNRLSMTSERIHRWKQVFLSMDVAT